jgi:hypothetical protein
MNKKKKKKEKKRNRVYFILFYFNFSKFFWDVQMWVVHNTIEPFTNEYTLNPKP